MKKEKKSAFITYKVDQTQTREQSLSRTKAPAAPSKASFFVDRSERTEKGVLHPRNRHQGHYNLKQLMMTYPDLKKFLKPNPKGQDSIDFANADAVKTLNRALLKQYYGVTYWEFPDHFLCPPIPGRSDYVHHLADLLAVNLKANSVKVNGGFIPHGTQFRILDIGTGANCIYPIIGHCEYGWSFVGTDIEQESIESAQKIVTSNSVLDSIEIRHQKSPPHVFEGIWGEDEYFDMTMCNPPFHSSAEEADEVNQKKWRNLGKAAVANFGGKYNELWCEGGEAKFIERLIRESVEFGSRCLWFTSLVSKESTLSHLYAVLKEIDVFEYRVIDMAQGQKKSRLIAWTFLGGKAEWRHSK